MVDAGDVEKPALQKEGGRRINFTSIYSARDRVVGWLRDITGRGSEEKQGVQPTPQTEVVPPLPQGINLHLEKPSYPYHESVAQEELRMMAPAVLEAHHDIMQERLGRMLDLQGIGSDAALRNFDGVVVDDIDKQLQAGEKEGHVYDMNAIGRLKAALNERDTGWQDRDVYLFRSDSGSFAHITDVDIIQRATVNGADAERRINYEIHRMQTDGLDRFANSLIHPSSINDREYPGRSEPPYFVGRKVEGGPFEKIGFGTEIAQNARTIGVSVQEFLGQSGFSSAVYSIEPKLVSKATPVDQS